MFWGDTQLVQPAVGSAQRPRNTRGWASPFAAWWLEPWLGFCTSPEAMLPRTIDASSLRVPYKVVDMADARYVGPLCRR